MDGQQRRRRGARRMRGGAVAGLAAAVMSIAMAAAATADAPAPATDGVERPAIHHGVAAVLPPEATVGGIGYPELSERWWRWGLDAPIPPWIDPDGRFCDIGQSGDVWFLAGTSGEDVVRRECVVPAGRHLFLPVINMVYMQPAGGTTPCTGLQADAAENNDRLSSAVVLVDGEPLADIARFRVRSRGCFALELDSAGQPKWTSRRAASDGYWLLLAPLRPGRHTISIGANYGDGERAFAGMTQNFEYVLHVGGGTTVAQRSSPGGPEAAAAP